MNRFEDLDAFQKAAVAVIIKSAAQNPSGGGYDFGSVSDEIGDAFSGLGRGLRSTGRQLASGVGDLGTGLGKDIEDIRQNFANTWARRRKESRYGNFANIGPLIPLGLTGAYFGGKGIKSIIGKLLRRGR
jgi:hypothetical protein